MTSFSTMWSNELQANLPYLMTLLGLTALDLLLGVARALAAKRFQSGLLRNTLSKLIQELGLPILLALLGVANHAFAALVTGALWLAIVAEATSLVEQLRGKTTGGIWGDILNLLHDVKTQQGQNTSPSDSQPPTTGGGA
ncbi:phage holin family protein [Sulfobacillus harzensis]|uniref:Holin n=1 Tax=Sulfobacillus harzensis TaxID=2729629 RepID=A0A7Y0Q4I1_9FIRM|nr:phage holin family protein [Sulfobacillus harzensis]NMP24046.1 hypothetical protein [Sulfobacillus harzensis]